MNYVDYRESIDVLITKYKKFYENIDDVDVFNFVENCYFQIRFVGDDQKGYARVLLRVYDCRTCVIKFKLCKDLIDFVDIFKSILDIQLSILLDYVFDKYYLTEKYSKEVYE